MNSLVHDLQTEFECNKNSQLKVLADKLAEVINTYEKAVIDAYKTVMTSLVNRGNIFTDSAIDLWASASQQTYSATAAALAVWAVHPETEALWATYVTALFTSAQTETLAMTGAQVALTKAESGAEQSVSQSMSLISKCFYIIEL